MITVQPSYKKREAMIEIVGHPHAYLKYQMFLTLSLTRHPHEFPNMRILSSFVGTLNFLKRKMGALRFIK